MSTASPCVDANIIRISLARNYGCEGRDSQPACCSFTETNSTEREILDLLTSHTSNFFLRKTTDCLLTKDMDDLYKSSYKLNVPSFCTMLVPATVILRTTIHAKTLSQSWNWIYVKP